MNDEASIASRGGHGELDPVAFGFALIQMGLDVCHFVRREGSAHRAAAACHRRAAVAWPGVGDHLRFGWVDSVVAGDGDGGINGIHSFEFADRGFIRGFHRSSKEVCDIRLLQGFAVDQPPGSPLVGCYGWLVVFRELSGVFGQV